MWYETIYDDKEVECQFCYQKVFPIVKQNIWTMGKHLPIVGWWKVKRTPPKRHILICPNCKALIGAK